MYNMASRPIYQETEMALSLWGERSEYCQYCGKTLTMHMPGETTHYGFQHTLALKRRQHLQSCNDMHDERCDVCLAELKYCKKCLRTRIYEVWDCDYGHVNHHNHGWRITFLQSLRKKLSELVSQQMTILFGHLVLLDHIDKQAYPNQLCKLCDISLAYENINNNLSRYGHKSRQYDYRVSGPLDLTKLFLDSTLLRTFSDFHTCCIAVLLQIIISTNKQAFSAELTFLAIQHNRLLERNPLMADSRELYCVLYTIHQIIDTELLLTERDKNYTETKEHWKRVHGIRKEEFKENVGGVTIAIENKEQKIESCFKLPNFKLSTEEMLSKKRQQDSSKPRHENTWKEWTKKNINSFERYDLRYKFMDLVGQVFKSIWTKLKRLHDIDEQTYVCYLELKNSKLRYKNINGNWGKKHTTQYDYRIRSPVDLSKLFIQYCSFNYSTFHDCTISALLELITSTAHGMTLRERYEFRWIWLLQDTLEKTNFEPVDVTNVNAFIGLINANMIRISQIFDQLRVADQLTLVKFGKKEELPIHDFFGDEKGDLAISVSDRGDIIRKAERMKLREPDELTLHEEKIQVPSLSNVSLLPKYIAPAGQEIWVNHLITAVNLNSYQFLQSILQSKTTLSRNEFETILEFSNKGRGSSLFVTKMLEEMYRFVYPGLLFDECSSGESALKFMRDFLDFIWSTSLVEKVTTDTKNGDYSRIDHSPENLNLTEYLSKFEKISIKILLPSHIIQKRSFNTILDGISSRYAINMIRSILKSEFRVRDNYHLLSFVVGQALKPTFDLMLLDLEWNTVLLSASSANNYNLVNFLLQCKDYSGLEIEKAFEAACETRADYKLVAILMEAFDLNCDHVLKLVNSVFKHQLYNAEHVELVITFLERNPDFAEVVIALGICERRYDLIEAIFDRITVETINISAVLCYVSRNGDSDMVRSMLSKYKLNMFDINAAVYSASLAGKYENVTAILKNTDTSELDLEYLVDRLTVVNGLSREIIDIIVKYCSELVKEIVIEKSLEHLPHIFRWVMNEYSPGHKTKYYVLMKACSQDNLENVHWLLKKRLSHLEASSVLQCVHRSLHSGQFRIAQFLLRYLKKDNLYDDAIIKLIEITIYRMFHEYLKKSIGTHNINTAVRDPSSKVKVFNKDANVFATLNNLFPAQATTDVLHSIEAGLDMCFRDINCPSSNECNIKDLKFQSCKRTDWTLDGMFVDVMVDEPLDPRRLQKPTEHKVRNKHSGEVDQSTSRIHQMDYLIKCKRMTEMEISDKECRELFQIAVSHGFELSCRYLMGADKGHILDEDLELGIYKSIFLYNIFSNGSNCENFLGTARALIWELTRRYYRLNINKVKFIRLYPATKCDCKSKRSSDSDRGVCSYDFVLVAEVDKCYSNLDRFFGSFEVKYVYGSVNSASNNIKRYGDMFLKQIDRSICIDHGVSVDVAKHLFKSHSNLVSVVPSVLRSIDSNTCGQDIEVEKCVSFYCHLKGCIPFGDMHFPEKVKAGELEYPTDVVQGTFKLTKPVLRVGDQIKSNNLVGTLGGFVSYYNQNCFLTCAHVILDVQSLKLRPVNFHGRDLRFFVKDNNNQEVVCGSLIRYEFEEGSNNQPGIDAAIAMCNENEIHLNEKQYVTDHNGTIQNFQFLGLKSPYLNEKGNIVDHELLTITKKRVPTRAFSPQIKIVDNNTTFCQEQFIEVELNSPGQQSAIVNGVTHSPIMIASPSHFQHNAIGENFRMYKQMYLNIPLSAGDSGTCIYIADASGQQGQSYNTSGCVGMAIAFLNGMSVVTPMKNIIEKLF